MDTRTFIVELIEVIIWPVITLVILAIIWKPIFKLLPFLSKLKVGEIEAEFEKTMDIIKNSLDEDADMTTTNTLVPNKNISDEKEHLFRLAEIAPNAAILEAWSKVELAARRLIAARGFHPDYEIAYPYKLIEKTLIKEEIIETKKIKVFNELRNLRNKIAHAHNFEISIEQAKEYVYLSQSLADYFEHLIDNKQHPHR